MHSSPAVKKVLVVGLGVSGLSTAIRLDQAGWQVTIVEKAAERRRGGYFLALFGSGEAAAERLGFGDLIPDRAAPDGVTYEVDREGRRRPGLGYSDLPGKAKLVMRGDIEDAAFRRLPPEVAVRYATVPTSIRQDGDTVEVDLREADGTTTTERYDLVVGADGLRSTTRSLVFDPASVHMYRLGFMIAAFSLETSVPGLRQRDSMIVAERGRSAWVFSFADRPPTVLFSYATSDVDAEFSRPAIDSVRAAFGPTAPGSSLGWLLDRFEESPDFLFDSAEQVRLDHWHKGRVVLVGDAAWCPTLYSGMGASTGMAGADLLGTMLERYPDDVAQALEAWESRLAVFVKHHQASGVSSRRIFTPQTRREHLGRSIMIRLSKLPVARSLLSASQTNSADAKMKMMDIGAA